MGKLTLYRTLCGRWPAGATAVIRGPGESWQPGEPTCESCLRISSRMWGGGQFVGGGTWIVKRPGLSWHLLIPNYQDADPALLPRDAQPRG